MTSTVSPIIGADPKSEKRRKAAHAKAIAAGAKCERCPLYGARQGPVPGEFRPSARLLVIGEAPGKDEVDEGRPFIGASGKVMSVAARDGGVVRGECSITNVVACRPPGKGNLDKFRKIHRKRIKAMGLPPEETLLDPVEACSGRLHGEIEGFGGETILALGKVAHEAVAHAHGLRVGKKQKGRVERDESGANIARIASLKFQRGHPYILPNGKRYLPTYHPAWALRDKPQWRHLVENDIRRAAEVAALGWEHEEPAFIVEPSLAQIHRWCAQVLRRGLQVDVDIETDSLKYDARIRCIGLGVIDPKTSRKSILVVPVRSKTTGRPYWKGRASIEEFERMKASVRSVLDSNPLTFHNGGFDTIKLRLHGWQSTGGEHDFRPWFDTMLALKDSRETSAERSLAFLTSILPWRLFPNWKVDVDHKATEEGETDHEYYVYNGRDIDATGDGRVYMQERLHEDGTEDQFERDSRILAIARNMTEIGLPISERRLRRNSARVHAALRIKSRKLKRIAGRDLNFGSSAQLSKLLFDDWKNDPVLNSEKEPFREELGDTPSTGIDALMAIQDRGCDARTSEFVDELIVWKSLEKLRSSFIDNLLHPDPDEDDPLPVTREKGVPGIVWLHPSWTLGPPSGRFASSPNVQNWPKAAYINLRKMIVAPPGYAIVSADFEQGEARLFAVEAEDELMIEAFKRGLDVHALNWASLGRESFEDQLREHDRIQVLRKSKSPEDQREAAQARLVAKVFCFAEQYGATGPTIRSHMMAFRRKDTGERVFADLNPRLPIRWHEAYHRTHPNAKPWQRSVLKFVREHGFAEEPVHKRRRHFPGGPQSPNDPPNHVIQGAMAAYANEAFEEIANAIGHRRWGRFAGLVNQIHDEIVALVPVERVEETLGIFDRAMNFDHGGIRMYGEAEASLTWTAKRRSPARLIAADNFRRAA